MRFSPPKGWDKESEKLFIHDNGTRIERRVYREVEGWFIIPVDPDVEVTGFDPTPEGRDRAFAAFAEIKVRTPRKPKKVEEPADPPKKKRGRKPKERPEPEEGEGGPPKDAEGEEPAEKDEDEDEEDEDEARPAPASPDI